MRIRVLYNWGGVPSGDRRVEPGEYETDDPRLFGCGDYLVRNGHAVVVKETAPPEETAPETEPPKRKRKGDT